MPKVNATVLTLYLPILDADGFILGEIGPLGNPDFHHLLDRVNAKVGGERNIKRDLVRVKPNKLREGRWQRC